MPAPTGFTTVSATHLQDATGAVVASATIYFMPVDNHGNPISFLAGGAGGQVAARSVQANVTEGAFSVILADTTLSTPQNVGYAVTCIDNLTGGDILGPGYSCVQPSGATWNFDSYIPNLAPLVSVIVGAKGDTGPQGPPGTNGTNGTNGTLDAAGVGVVASLIAGALPSTRNLFDKSLAVSNFSIHPQDGTLISDAGHTATGFVPVAGLSHITTSVNQNDQNSNFGYAWYDASQNYLSGSSTNASTLTVPSGACFYRQGFDTITGSTVNVDALMIVAGSSLPGSYISFGYNTPTEVDAKINAAIAVLPVSATQEFALDAAAATQPAIPNLLDLTRVTDGFSIHPQDGTLIAFSGQTASDYIFIAGASNVIAVEQSNSLNANYGYAFYDLSKTYISGANAGGNTPIPVPSGAAWFRTGMRTGFKQINMVCRGSTLPSSYIGYGYDDPATAATKVSAAIAASKLSTKTFGAFGDSISALFSPYWQTPVAANLGMTHVFNDAHGGRTTKDIFENYGGDGTGTYSGTPVGGAGVPPGTNGNWQIGQTTGHTLAQDLAAVNVLAVFLGTNDSGYVTGGTVGTPGDSPSRTGSFCAAIAFVLQTLQNANPAMRIVWVSPYQYNPANGHGGATTVAGNIALVNAIQGTCALWGVPVIDLMRTSGINSSNWTLALGDGLHPSTAGFTDFLVPAITKGLMGYN